MNAWIIYNGTLKTSKMIQIINHLVSKAKKLGFNLIPIENHTLLPFITKDGKPKIHYLHQYPEPNFILFWDKGTLLAKVLENLGYRVHNSSHSIDICDNKSLMHLELLNQNIVLPKTIFGPFTFWENNLSYDYAENIFNLLGKEIIIKESKGSFGMQVYKVKTKDELIQKVKEIKNNDFIFQEFIHNSSGRDIRVNIIGNEIIGAMERNNPNDFKANITNGATGKLIELTDKQKELSLKAHKYLGLDFSGVDLLYGEDDEPILCEVNSNVNFLSFIEATNIPYGELLLEYFLKKYT